MRFDYEGIFMIKTKKNQSQRRVLDILENWKNIINGLRNDDKKFVINLILKHRLQPDLCKSLIY